MILEGPFRKWFLPNLSSPIFAIKYILFGLTYTWYFINNPRISKINYSYQLIITILIIYSSLHLIYNPFNTSTLVVAMGFINYFFFIPLIIMTPAFFNSIERLIKFLKWLMIISIPIFILGIIQYFLPPDDILNKLVNEDQLFNKVGVYTRSMSVFTFVKTYNVYLLFTLTLLFSYLFYRIKNNLSIWLLTTVLLLGILNMFMTSSRLPIGLLSINFLLIIFFSFLFIPKLRKSLTIFLVFASILFLSIYNLSSTYKIAVDAFFTRATIIETVAERKNLENYKATDRLTDRITAFKYSNESGLFGFGIGTTYQGTGMVLSNYRTDLPFEEEGERIVLELGIIGGILLILLRWSIFLFALLSFLNTKKVSITLLKIALLLVILPPIFFLNNPTFNYFDGFSYWFSFALILALNHIEMKQLNEN